MNPLGVNPYVLLGVGVGAAWLLSLAGVGYWQYGVGQDAERVEWQDRENEELRTANATITLLQNEARQTEQAHAKRLAETSGKYEKEKAHEIAKRERVIADLRSGAVRLRDPGTTGQRACGSEGCGIAAAPGKCDGPAGGELSGQLAEFLVSEAGRADEVVRQLQACQEVVISDREGK